MSGQNGVFKVKNNTESTLEIAELGGMELESEAELDFLDEAIEPHYVEYEAVKRAAEMTTTDLHDMLQDERLVVVEDVPPRMPLGMGPAGAE